MSRSGEGAGGDVLGRGRLGIAQLDHLLRNHPAQVAAELTTALRGVVALRDEMIGRRDRNGRGAGADDRLERVNAALSLLIGSEFPLAGVRWKRIGLARDSLKEIISEEEAEARRT